MIGHEVNVLELDGHQLAVLVRWCECHVVVAECVGVFTGNWGRSQLLIRDVVKPRFLSAHVDFGAGVDIEALFADWCGGADGRHR